MKVIYEPRGKAREYSELALNLYNGCNHGCTYCYVPQILYKNREQFQQQVKARDNILQMLAKDASEMAKNKDDRTILMSFTSDPYQPLETELHLTSRAIDILMSNNLRFTILTKGGLRSICDMRKYRGYGKASYGVTLHTLDEDLTREYEPYAASAHDRVVALRRAKELGIRTWVSVEPVINPDHTLDMIRRIHGLVDEFKVGKLNHFPEIERKIDWNKFHRDVVGLLRDLGKDYYIKKDLAKFV